MPLRRQDRITTFLPVSMSAPLPDSVLITSVQSGEFGAFDVLYRRHYSRIHSVILSIVSNPEDALDLTQDVFLKAYQRLDTFKHASQFYSWLYRIAVNRCIDHMRRQSKHHVVIDEPFCEETFYREPASAVENPDNPLASLERAEFHRQLHAALPALTPNQRTVFVMRYTEQLPVKTIARKLGRSTGTVKAHLFYARRTLHDQLLPYFQCTL